MPRLLLACLCLSVLAPTSRVSAEDDPVFSGPQAGEKLPPLSVRVVQGDEAGEEVDLVAAAAGKPQLIIFVHARTRPAFGLMNTVMRFADSRSDKGLKAAYVFLTDDPTETETWLGRLRGGQYFAEGVPRTLSLDGAEGPGAYGLNRNVTLTVLVANEGRVTANFALVQPSEQADGPKIFKAVVHATGGGEVPPIAEFGRQPYRGMTARPDPLAQMLVGLMTDAKLTDEQVPEVVRLIEAYVADAAATRGPQIGQAADLALKSPEVRRRNLPAAARTKLEVWARGAALRARTGDANETDPNLRGLIAPMIAKNATSEMVQAAAQKIEEYIAKNPAARQQVGRISRTIVDSGKLANYGTPAAQEQLRKWAKEISVEADRSKPR